MKKIIFAMFASAALLLCMTGCSKDDDSSPDISAMEKELVGLWWDEFEYADVTEDGVPFNRVLLAVKADADHTGCLYAGVFEDTNDEPLAIYGGPEDAGFAWRLLDNGTLVLSDPATGETYALSRTLTRGDSISYGNNMTNVSSTKLTYTNGSVTATNGNYSGTLTKADANQTTDIEQKLRKTIQSNVNLESGGSAPKSFRDRDIR